MKVCSTCNTAVKDDVAFCPNCGSHLPASQSVYRRRSEKEPISVGGWIGRSLIPCIPLLGGIIYLVMLFLWSGDKNREDTFRNWAKAQLIMLAIGIVLTIIAVVLGITVFSEYF